MHEPRNSHVPWGSERILGEGLMKALWLSPIVLELSCWRLANSGSPPLLCDVISQLWPCSVLRKPCHGLKSGRFWLQASGMLKFYCQNEVLGLRLYIRSKWLSPSGLWSKACWALSPGSQGYSHVDSTKPQTWWRICCPHMAVSLAVLSVMLPGCLFLLITTPLSSCSLLCALNSDWEWTESPCNACV